MQVIVLTVREPTEGFESRQVFWDDPSGAVAEIQYWEKRGVQVEVEQFHEGSDSLQ